MFDVCPVAAVLEDLQQSRAQSDMADVVQEQGEDGARLLDAVFRDGFTKLKNNHRLGLGLVCDPSWCLVQVSIYLSLSSFLLHYQSEVVNT